MWLGRENIGVEHFNVGVHNGKIRRPGFGMVGLDGSRGDDGLRSIPTVANRLFHFFYFGKGAGRQSGHSPRATDNAPKNSLQDE